MLQQIHSAEREMIASVLAAAAELDAVGTSDMNHAIAALENSQAEALARLDEAAARVGRCLAGMARRMAEIGARLAATIGATQGILESPAKGTHSVNTLPADAIGASSEVPKMPAKGIQIADPLPAGRVPDVGQSSADDSAEGFTDASKTHQPATDSADEVTETHPIASQDRNSTADDLPASSPDGMLPFTADIPDDDTAEDDDMAAWEAARAAREAEDREALLEEMHAWESGEGVTETVHVHANGPVPPTTPPKGRKRNKRK